MRLRAITLEQVLMLHAYVLADTSGGEGLRDIGRLEAALASQSQRFLAQNYILTL